MRRRSALDRGARTVTLAAILTAIFATASMAQTQSTSKSEVIVRFDERQAADLLREQRDGGMDLSRLLRQVGSVEVRSPAPVRLILHVYLMRGKDVVRQYASRPFDAPTRGSVPLHDVLPKGEPGFGSFAFDPANLLEAVEMIPAGAAVEEPGRFVINGVIPFHPKDWEKMASVYVVAAPISGQPATGTRGSLGWPTSRQAPVGIGVLFGTPIRSGR